MSKQDTHLALLPSGFVDLLPPESGQEARAITVLMEHFAAFGYERIKPPLAEFEDSLLAPGPGAALAHETFRLMDPVSHRMLGVRSDITPQIARIASSRLVAAPRPLRLSYANDVLRTKGSQQRTERQFCQVGCELIGAEGPEAEIEICMLALLGLRDLGLKNVTIDLTIPGLVSALLNENDFDGKKMAEAQAAVDRRARDAIVKIGGPAGKSLGALLEAAGDASHALKKLSAVKLPAGLRGDIENLRAVYEGLARGMKQAGLDDFAVTIDPLESRGFEYHRSIGFTLFAKGGRGELGRGGRYDVRFGAGKKGESAAGFTLYMDTIRKALPQPKKKQVVCVPAGESWAAIRAMQEKGKIVVRDTAVQRKKKSKKPGRKK